MTESGPKDYNILSLRWLSSAICSKPECLWPYGWGAGGENVGLGFVSSLGRAGERAQDVRLGRVARGKSQIRRP